MGDVEVKYLKTQREYGLGSRDSSNPAEEIL
jgi:hypothetical protein